MDAVVLTWRWQNLLTVWIMIVILVLLVSLGSQIMMRKAGKAASDAAR